MVADAPELTQLTSSSKRQKLSEHLKAALAKHVSVELAPALTQALARSFPLGQVDLQVSDDKEKLWVFYPSAVENTDAYLRPSVLIEFGGRNSTLPQSTVAIKPDVAPYVTSVGMPTANVSVLSAERTFWEKASLIHVECHREGQKPNAERLSRHWYDLACLADHQAGKAAIQSKRSINPVLVAWA